MRSDLIHDQCEYLRYVGVVRLYGADTRVLMV